MTAQEQGITSSLKRYMAIPRVLVFLEHDRRLLLLKGAPTKKIWPNLYNGVGGHIEKDESILLAALREIEEETGLPSTAIVHLSLRAVVNILGDHESIGILMFVFHGTVRTNAVTPSQEGALEWHPINLLPFSQMVPDLPTLIPAILKHTSSEPLYGRYYYEDKNLIIDLDGS